MPDENPSGLGAFDLPLRLPGQYFDKETNLHYNYYRDYDPSIGRYGESDPIGLEGGLNTYSYVAGNPLARIDPLGLDNPGMGPYGPKWSRNGTFSESLERTLAGERTCVQTCMQDFILFTAIEEIGIHGAGHLARPLSRAVPAASVTGLALGSRAFERCLKEKCANRCLPFPG